VRRSVETKCRLCPPLQIWEARIRLAWRGSARHSDGSSLLIFEEKWPNDTAGPKTTQKVTRCKSASP